jgi:hypothetical protein
MTVATPSRSGRGRPATTPVTTPGTRPAWRTVAMPSEHGGWGLTLEPVVLGLALAPSVAGVAIGLAGLLAFLVRTPLKLAVVDHRRGRSLPRTALARRIAVVESAAIAALGALALVMAGPMWLVPIAVAVPLVAVELWFDVRSRGRRLAPELCGAGGMAALAASVALAGGAPAAAATAAWLLLAGRAVAAIPYVRTQVLRLHRTGDARPGPGGALVAQAGGLGIAVAAVAAEPAALAGAVAVAVTSVVRLVGLQRPPRSAPRLGAVETVLGVVVVVATAVGLHLGGAL